METRSLEATFTCPALFMWITYPSSPAHHVPPVPVGDQQDLLDHRVNLVHLVHPQAHRVLQDHRGQMAPLVLRAHRESLDRLAVRDLQDQQAETVHLVFRACREYPDPLGVRVLQGPSGPMAPLDLRATKAPRELQVLVLPGLRATRVPRVLQEVQGRWDHLGVPRDPADHKVQLDLLGVHLDRPDHREEMGEMVHRGIKGYREWLVRQDLLENRVHKVRKVLPDPVGQSVHKVQQALQVQEDHSALRDLREYLALLVGKVLLVLLVLWDPWGR